jgi:hypothetical protein
MALPASVALPIMTHARPARDVTNMAKLAKGNELGIRVTVAAFVVGLSRRKI